MPSDAFYNLSSDRKEKLLNAAVQEFSIHPYSKVSVFKIAQNAEISRSTFYYYFKDKRDIYEYLMMEIKDDFLKNLGEYEEPIDIFWLSEKVFDYIASIKGTDREPFFRNVVENTTTESIDLLFNVPELHCIDKKIKDLCKLDELNIQQDEELKEVIFLLAGSIMYSIGGYLTNHLTLDEAREKRNRMSEVVKNGVLKRSEG